MHKRRVAITGIGVVTPLGIGHESLWNGLLNKSSGIRPIDAFDASKFKSRIAGGVPAFKMGDFVPSSELRQQCVERPLRRPLDILLGQMHPQLAPRWAVQEIDI